jgi:trigger factor
VSAGTLQTRMRSSVAPLEGNKVKVTVEVDEQEFEKAIDAAFRKIAKEVRIPGFRPGKAPRKLLEARLGTGVARDEAFRDALPGYYAQAVREHDVDVIDAPEIDITEGQETGPIVFDAVVEVRPQVDVPGYGSLKVALDRPLVGDDEVDAQIDRMREVDSELVVVERPATTGDSITIDIAGTVGGEAQPGLTADDYLYEVGSGSVVPELDEQLQGAKVGDILEFVAAHPDPDEGEISFRILVKDIKEKVLPEVTDEWAAEASEFGTVDALRDSLTTRMLTVRKAQSQMALREKTAEALAELVEQDVPEPLITGEMQQRLQDLAMRLQAQGIGLEQWFAMSGKTPEEVSSELRETATQSVKVDLALRAVADAEGLEVTDDDLDAEYASVAERVGEEASAIRDRFERAEQVSAVRSDIRKRKALDWLLEQVEIVDEEGLAIDRADLEITAEAAPAPSSDEPTTEEEIEEDDAE